MTRKTELRNTIVLIVFLLSSVAASGQEITFTGRHEAAFISKSAETYTDHFHPSSFCTVSYEKWQPCTASYQT